MLHVQMSALAENRACSDCVQLGLVNTAACITWSCKPYQQLEDMLGP